MTREAVEVVGIFAHLDKLLQTVPRLREAGVMNLMVLSPIPCPEIDQHLAQGESPVRRFTLLGGVIGGLIGLSLTIGTALRYPLLSGGKPIISLPPFLIITFELTILFGALATVLGMLWSMRRPGFKLEAYYDPRFSTDRFGVRVLCRNAQCDTVEAILSTAGAEEIHREEH